VVNYVLPLLAELHSRPPELTKSLVYW